MRAILSTWLVMLLLAVANGAVRDLTYGRAMSELAAHQLSTVIGAVLLGIVMWRYVARHPPASAGQALALGLSWTSLTIAFEFLFFHFAGNRPWPELLANYDLSAGRVWVLLLAWIAGGPYLFYRWRCRRRGTQAASSS